MTHRVRVGIIAGEASGDLLGAGMIRALRERVPELHCFGLGGPQMIAEGFDSLDSYEQLSVMGLIDPLLRLPTLLQLRARLLKDLLRNPPQLFVGIDSPDFNLPVAGKLYRHGIRTVHYVSPSVWAWRRRRIKKISRSIDLMLTLFPFETEIYRLAGIPVRCVGHPLAEHLHRESDTGLSRTGSEGAVDKLVAVLPGSRASEVKRMGPLFLATAERCILRRKDLRFIISAADQHCAEILKSSMNSLVSAVRTHLTISSAPSQNLLKSSDCALLTLGTATLEAMLLKVPMVTAYRLDPLSYAIVNPLLKIRWKSLPNLLAGRELVPEMVQGAATPEALERRLLNLLDMEAEEQQKLQNDFEILAKGLRCGGNAAVAQALLPFLSRTSSGP